ncbi:MAG TPA: hypothetical protein VNM40_01725 [Candidatus Paceibacterota bacterium]|nr:hypothetical protein [Candidatus Paceibacterota bacterium]
MNKLIASSVIALGFLVFVMLVPVIGMVSNPEINVFGVVLASDGMYEITEGDWSWDFDGYAPSYDISEGGWNWGFDSGCYNCYDPCWDCGYTSYYYDDYCYHCYSYRTPTYYTPLCYDCGGHYSVIPVVTQGARPSGGGGGSQSQSQSQSQVSNNTNTNTNNNVNINNNTAVAVAQVQIGGQTASYPTPSYPTYPAPYCNIYQAQSGSYGSYGVRPVYLSWNSSNAQSAYLSNYGSVGVNGSQTVYPSYTTTYTLTVYGYNGQQATCQTTVYASTYTPTTPYVSLTQIPYTGFDFGPIGNAMYWAGLAVFALGGAFLAVYYIPSLIAGRSAFANSFATRQYTPVVVPKAPILLEKEAEAKVAPIVESLRKTGTTDAMAIVQSPGSMPKITIVRS